MKRLHDVGGEADVEGQPPDLRPVHRYSENKEDYQWRQDSRGSLDVKRPPEVRLRTCATKDAGNQKSGYNEEKSNALPSVWWIEYMVNKHHQHGYPTKTVESSKTIRLGL